MKCPNCGGQMGLEDAACPYCGTPNAQAVQHQSDMARFRQDYQRTRADVLEKTSLLQRQGSWLVVLAVLLVALVAGMVLKANAWDIGYSIRTGNVEQAQAEDYRVMDSFLEQGDYGKFMGYYEANDISLDYDNPYDALNTAARAYVDLLQYVGDLNDATSYAWSPQRLSDTCGYVAEDLNRIFTLEERYSYDLDRYLPADKRVYVDDIRSRAAAVAGAYFGLDAQDVVDIPQMSTSRLAALLEEGVAR